LKALSELVKVVTDYRLDNVPIFSIHNRKDKSSKYNQFLDGMLKERYKDDEDAALSLYNCSTEDVKYRVLKNRIKERLYNNILFIDSGKRSSNSYSGVYLKLYRHMIVSRFLVGWNAKTAGYELMTKVLNKAIKYQMHDIVQQCALHFRRQSMLEGSNRRFDYYNELFQNANNSLMAEVKAEELYYTIALSLNKSVSPTPDLIEKAKECTVSISQLMEKYQTYSINYYDHSIKSIYFQLISDYSAAIASCERFDQYLKDNPIFYSNARHANNLVIKGTCYLHLGNYQKGIECAREALTQYEEGSENWFILQELYFLLLFNSNDLYGATEIYCNVIIHNRFNYIRTQLQELWKVFGGYLWFMINYYNDDKCLKLLAAQKQTFRFSKLLNEIPIFSRDKKGMNVAVLILQILLLLEKREFVKIISRMEALKSYTYRNLGKDDAYRSHYFIKMLLAMEKAQFDPARTEEKTTALLDKLRRGDLNYTSTQTRMEIISYEKLWNIAIDLIKEKKTDNTRLQPAY
jgi:tetratricopeptide (TPR) repeat protein